MSSLKVLLAHFVLKNSITYKSERNRCEVAFFNGNFSILVEQWLSFVFITIFMDTEEGRVKYRLLQEVLSPEKIS
jgi:hypothetical protein